jgi:hypothetical protein
MADDTLRQHDTGCGERTPVRAETELQQRRTIGTWMARALLSTLASALVLFTVFLAWAVTIVGSGWYLLLAAFCFMVPLPLRFFLTDRRRGKSIPRRDSWS